MDVDSDRLVADTLERVWNFVKQRDDAWNIPPEEGRFLYSMALATGAARLLELGTSYGCSSLWLAWAARKNHGRLITIDKEQRKRDQAMEHLGQAGLDGVVVARVGQITDVLTELDGPFDFAFIDADKEPTRQYIDLLLDRLTDRATVLIDNVISHPEAFGDSLDYIRSHPSLWAMTVPVGHGVELLVKVEENSK